MEENLILIWRQPSGVDRKAVFHTWARAGAEEAFLVPSGEHVLDGPHQQAGGGGGGDAGAEGEARLPPGRRVAHGEKAQGGGEGAAGEDGVGIEKIEKTGTVGLVDTYRITFSDSSYFTFTVTNGKNGESADLATVKQWVENAILNGEW